MEMADVRKVFITKEVAERLDINPSYLLRLAKSMNLPPDEMREAGKRNYLFSEEAVEKLKKYMEGGAEHGKMENGIS